MVERTAGDRNRVVNRNLGQLEPGVRRRRRKVETCRLTGITRLERYGFAAHRDVKPVPGLHFVRLAIDGNRAGALADVHGAKLTSLEERLCRVVELRFFAGLTIDETAASLGVSTATVERDWTVAKAWLYDRLFSSRE